MILQNIPIKQISIITGLTEKEILSLRFGLNGYEELTQKETAEKLGISQSYISRLEKRIIKKLKNNLKENLKV